MQKLFALMPLFQIWWKNLSEREQISSIVSKA